MLMVCFRVKKDDSTTFTLLVASAKLQPEVKVDLEKGATLTIKYGDMQKPLAKAVSYLQEVRAYSLIL
jgi:hypothetical protein